MFPSGSFSTMGQVLSWALAVGKIRSSHVIVIILSLTLLQEWQATTTTTSALAPPMMTMMMKKHNGGDGLLLGRREYIRNGISSVLVPVTIGLVTVGDPIVAQAAETTTGPTGGLMELQSTLQKARDQLEPVPDIIREEKWDKIRAILITSPLSDCWTTTKKGGLLLNIADAVGNADGDELAVLELREELVSHLRFLDMSAYNNVFNPISSEGSSGATKELVRSYYEDPKNELLASKNSLDAILAEISSITSKK